MTPSYYHATTGNSLGDCLAPLSTTPYRDAADALHLAHRTAVDQQRPFAERRHLAAAEALCRRLADQTREDEQ